MTSAEISEHLHIRGFHGVARLVCTAAPADEVTALRLALATVDGAQQMLRCYARSLRNTRAATERAHLRELERVILARLGAMARNVQAEGVCEKTF